MLFKEKNKTFHFVKYFAIAFINYFPLQGTDFFTDSYSRNKRSHLNSGRTG